MFSPQGFGTCAIAAAVGLSALYLLLVSIPRTAAARGRHPLPLVAAGFLAFLLALTGVTGAGAVLANRAFGLYPTWDDIIPTAPHDTLDSDKTFPSSGAMSRLPVLPPAQSLTPGTWYAATVPGPYRNASSHVEVYIPKGVVPSANKNEGYSVLVVFNGTPGSPQVWRKNFHLDTHLDAAMSEGRVRPTIIVAIQAFGGGVDSECVDPTPGGKDAHRGARWETWLSTHVPSWISTRLPTLSPGAGWATMGYSAGGWCASMLSLRHPDIYSHAVSLGGYFTPLYAHGQNWTRTDDPRYDLPAVAASTAPRSRVLLIRGRHDALAAKTQPHMESAVRAPTSLTVWVTSRGGHAVQAWTPWADECLRWLAASDSQFSGATAARQSSA